MQSIDPHSANAEVIYNLVNWTYSVGQHSMTVTQTKLRPQPSLSNAEIVAKCQHLLDGDWFAHIYNEKVSAALSNLSLGLVNES